MERSKGLLFHWGKGSFAFPDGHFSSLTASLTCDSLQQIVLILLIPVSSEYLWFGFHSNIVLDSQIFLF